MRAKHTLRQLFSPVLLTCIAIADRKCPVNSPRTCSMDANATSSLPFELCTCLPSHASWLTCTTQSHQITSTAGSSHEP